VLGLALEQEFGADFHDPVDQDGAFPLFDLRVLSQGEVAEVLETLVFALAHGVIHVEANHQRVLLGRLLENSRLGAVAVCGGGLVRLLSGIGDSLVVLLIFFISARHLIRTVIGHLMVSIHL